MHFMDAVRTEIERRLQSIDYSNRKSTLTSIDYRSIDRVLDSYKELVPESYRGWHVNKLKVIGVDKYIELAERAKKYGKNPQKLFAQILKQY